MLLSLGKYLYVLYALARGFKPHCGSRPGRFRHPRPLLPARPYLLHPWSRASRGTCTSLCIGRFRRPASRGTRTSLCIAGGVLSCRHKKVPKEGPPIARRAKTARFPVLLAPPGLRYS